MDIIWLCCIKCKRQAIEFPCEIEIILNMIILLVISVFQYTKQPFHGLVPQGERKVL